MHDFDVGLLLRVCYPKRSSGHTLCLPPLYLKLYLLIRSFYTWCWKVQIKVPRKCVLSEHYRVVLRDHPFNLKGVYGFFGKIFSVSDMKALYALKIIVFEEKKLCPDKLHHEGKRYILTTNKNIAPTHTLS